MLKLGCCVHPDQNFWLRAWLPLLVFTKRSCGLFSIWSVWFSHSSENLVLFSSRIFFFGTDQFWIE